MKKKRRKKLIEATLILGDAANVIERFGKRLPQWKLMAQDLEDLIEHIQAELRPEQ